MPLITEIRKTAIAARLPSLAALCLAVFLVTAVPGAAFGDASVTRAEWTSFLQRDPALQTADAKLNATYRRIIAGLSPEGRKALIAEQRAWIRHRDANAFSRHPKGSPEYRRLLADATLEREALLRERHRARAPEKPAAPPPPSAAAITKAPTAEPPAAPSGEQSAPKAAHTRRETDGQKNAAKAAPPSETTKEPRAEKPAVTASMPKPPARILDITPGEFARGYNRLAHALRAAAFPPAPTRVSGGGQTRTEHYQIADDISLQFKYTGGYFEKPEIITFLARRFMNGSAKDKDEIAYALANALKSLAARGSPQPPAARDAAISGFLRSIGTPFTADMSRVWKNAGLVYVVTYMKKSDLFAMVITRNAP